MSWQLFTSALSGGMTVKILDFIYSEYKGRKDKSYSAKAIVDKHIDPILKSADQLLGQLILLAKKDFQPLFKNTNSSSITTDIEVLYITYLFSHFWARLEILQIEGIHVNLTERHEGKLLLKFISTLGANRNRLLTKAQQQVIGESLINNTTALKTKSFYAFVEEYTSESPLNKWFKPLVDLITGTEDKRTRQKILLYGAILHALVDNLDPKHDYIRDRESYPNKLTEKTRNDLKNRIFAIYLPKVENAEKYWKVQ